jgi:hypothetical protein
MSTQNQQNPEPIAAAVVADSENAAMTMGNSGFSAVSAPEALPEAQGQPEALPLAPLPTVSDGPNEWRDPVTGRGRAGNKLAKGNQVGHKVSSFRARLLNACTDEEFDEMVQELKDRARRGEKWALQLALAYFCGPPEEVTQFRLAVLEEAILGGGQNE